LFASCIMAAYGIFTVIWCTLCMLIAFAVTGFTIHKFDHSSVLLIRPDSYSQSFTIRIASILSLLFYSISLICYTVAAYDWVIHDDANSTYYNARLAMFLCYAIAYLSMFFVLIERLKQMTLFIHKPYPNSIYLVLIVLILLGVIAFSSFFFIYHAKDNDSNQQFAHDTQHRGIALFFAVSGFLVHLSLSLAIIYLFFHRMYQHIYLQQHNLILSSSTEVYRDHHQHQIMLNMIKRYTSLSILSVLSTFVMMIPVLVYFANYARFHKDALFENATWWIIGLDQIINVLCIMLYLPLSIRLYHHVCCGMEVLCDRGVAVLMKRHIVSKLNQAMNSELD